MLVRIGLGQVYSALLHHAQAGHALVGSCCWAVAHAAYPDYDGFTVYLGGQPAELACYASGAVQTAASGNLSRAASLQPEVSSAAGPAQAASSVQLAVTSRRQRPPHRDSETVALIKQHAADMAALSAAAEQHCVVM